MDGARTRQCNPINQETPILGADASAAKVRVPVANVWRAWREEIRPARKAFQPPSPLQCVNTRHVMRELQAKHARYFAPARLALVIVYRQLVTLRLHSSGFTLFVSSCSLGSPLETASRPSATPTVCSRTNSRGLLFRGCRWRGQQPDRASQANPRLRG